MKKMKRALAGILTVAVLAGAYQYRIHRLQDSLSQQVLRFHVIANSNTKEDQALKLKVRDGIGAYLKEKLSGVDGLKECEIAVTEELGQIEQCARQIIAAEGYEYSVDAKVKTADFPKKHMGHSRSQKESTAR